MRLFRFSGFLYGLNTVGLLIIAARATLSFRLSALGDLPKKLCAAVDIPYAPFPKYKIFRYISKISFFVYFRSIARLRRIS